jgi:hypothetical protein
MKPRPFEPANPIIGATPNVTYMIVECPFATADNAQGRLDRATHSAAMKFTPSSYTVDIVAQGARETLASTKGNR